MITNIENDYQKIDEVDVGENVKICSFVNLYGCKIGNGSKVGSFVEIQKGSSIGCNCKIQSHTFICEGVHIGNGVFVGHNVSFINDKYPKAVNKDGDLIDSYDEWQLRQTFVEDEVSIGTSATIMGGGDDWKRCDDWGRRYGFKRCTTRMHCSRESSSYCKVNFFKYPFELIFERGML